jgi:predicted ATPase
MKIGVMGTQMIGKSTFINDFITNWTTYKVCEHIRYSELVKEKNLSLNENGTEESQKIILNSLIDQAMYSSKDKNIIFDRSVLDNLVYSMWLNANDKVTDKFIEESIKLVKESLVFYDILFFLPITKFSPIKFEEKDNRSGSAQYREEIDHIFKALVHQYNNGNKVFFPFDHKSGCPAIIEIYGNREERIELAKMYIQPDGSQFKEEQSLLLPNDPKVSDFK